MDGQRIRQLQARGYAIAASKAGLPHDHFRPSGTTNPLADANRLASLPVAWKPASPGDAFRGANLYGKPVWFGYWDLSRTQPGDYLVRQEDGGTWFIAAQQHLLQPAGVECNAVVDVRRPANPGRMPGEQTAYSGDTASTEAVIMSGWPCSMLQGSKGEKADIVMPDDTRLPWYTVLLPGAGVDILTNDVLTDARGNRYKVSSAELTDLGWRLSVSYSMT